MIRKAIPFDSFRLPVIRSWGKDWFLLTGGDHAKKQFNPMTVAWGSIGVMWGKPFAQVVVRPQRYTNRFMKKYPTFTLCAFPQAYRAALNLCGSTSGRDTDKVKAAGLKPIKSLKVAAPGFAEAELIIECRTMYRDQIRPAGFVDKTVVKNYPGKDYHDVYFGEIVAVSGTAKYKGK
jgi:flavin reductase (DIM6/NTAB) family NADH-FMN oxidoreductase RutF